MMKKFFILAVLLCCVISAVAMPAKPGLRTIKQSDGTTLTVQAVGNAFNHAILTTDGLTVARGADGDFYYTSSLSGLTTVRAHDENLRSVSEAAFVATQRANLVMSNRPLKLQPKKGRSKFGVGGSNADADVPSIGQRHIPIILVEFQDKKFSNTREDIIDAMLAGGESVGQYFRDQSNGLYEPDFDVFGIYTLSQNRQYYGGNNAVGNDKNLGAMVTEACQMAAADNVSFKSYDTNNDNYCDVVIIIFAGVGEAQATLTCPESIWPCYWDLNSTASNSQGGNGAFIPSDGEPLINNFAVFNELHGEDDNVSTIDGIGTFAHEFSHSLGLPDFYDTGNGGHYGMGFWDLMDMGCYNNEGFTPIGYSAYEKVFMGWIEYVTPMPSTHYTLPVFNQKNAATDKALCIVSDLNENEYFIVENRRKQGWDRYIPGEGIMITHVTYKQDRWLDNTPNNENIQLMTMMNADNTWSHDNEGTDLWPQGNKTEFTDSSTPAAILNMKSNGAITGTAGYLGKPVTEMVINQDGTASFWYMKDAEVNPAILVPSENIDFGGVNMTSAKELMFNLIGQALTDDVTLTLSDPNGVFNVNPTVVSATDAANVMPISLTFTPPAIADYNATLTLSSVGAEDVVINITGHGLIEGYTPVMLPANENAINLTQFRADWTDATPEANVASYTLEVDLKPTVELLGSLEGKDGSYTRIDPPAPWGGNNVWSGNHALFLAKGGSLTFTIPSGYSNGTFTVKITTVNSNSGIGNFTVATPQTPASSHSFSAGETYSWLVTASSGEQITITSTDANYSCDMALVEVYSGDATAVALRATEQGNDIYRLITGITEKFYTVTNLKAEGTFMYKVKTVFTDGTESEWSNVEEVTLFENCHGYVPGDVNHDDKLSIVDVTELINMLLGGSSNECPICADVNGDSKVSIVDVTELINLLLTNN
jgi:M6 family metalloprotease-like protein